VSRCCGTLKGVAADVIRGEGVWVLRRTSTMRVNIRVLVCDFLELWFKQWEQSSNYEVEEIEPNGEVAHCAHRKGT
jgi:hypothetical protein